MKYNREDKFDSFLASSQRIQIQDKHLTFISSFLLLRNNFMKIMTTNHTHTRQLASSHHPIKSQSCWSQELGVSQSLCELLLPLLLHQQELAWSPFIIKMLHLCLHFKWVGEESLDQVFAMYSCEPTRSVHPSLNNLHKSCTYLQQAWSQFSKWFASRNKSVLLHITGSCDVMKGL